MPQRNGKHEEVSLGNYLLAELKKNILPVEVDSPCGWISASCCFQYYENILIYTPDKWVHLPKIMQPKTVSRWILQCQGVGCWVQVNLDLHRLSLSLSLSPLGHQIFFFTSLAVAHENNILIDSAKCKI
ncbi:unnamed protein product [Musa banksii]